MATTKPFLFCRRGRAWTIVYPGPGGRTMQRSTGFLGPEGEAKAKRALALFIRRREAGAVLGGQGDDGPMTFARFAKIWIDTRAAKGIATVDDYRAKLEMHILPHIGHVRLDAVTTEHVVAVMAAAAHLASRTQRHVFYTMNPIFKMGVRRGLIETNPCAAVPEEDLPKKKDAVPGWRRQAKFLREEVEAILTSELIPWDRRVFYAVLFLGGCRFGEVSALLVDHYNAGMQPLGQLAIEFSYDSKHALIKETKTDNPRVMPVHPWLRQFLDSWLAQGWADLMGRQWKAGDILIPNRRGRHRNSSVMWRQLNGSAAKEARPAAKGKPARKARAAVLGDLERLGLRPRRQHDARRTLISLCRADGARKDILRLCTHGPEGDIMDVYSEIPWTTLCEEVAKLRIGPPPEAFKSGAAAIDNAAKSQDSGLPLGCHGEIQQSSLAVTERPQRDSKSRTSPGLPRTGADPDGQTAPIRHRPKPAPLTPAASGGSQGPMATLATLTLRQALAALEKGRLDQVRDILERAIEAERAAEAKAGQGGR